MLEREILWEGEMKQIRAKRNWRVFQQVLIHLQYTYSTVGEAFDEFVPEFVLLSLRCQQTFFVHFAELSVRSMITIVIFPVVVIIIIIT